MDLTPSFPWSSFGLRGRPALEVERRRRTSCRAGRDWQRQATTVSGTLAALLQSLRCASHTERRQRLRSASGVQLRIISAGLRLRSSDSRPTMVERIEEIYINLFLEDAKIESWEICGFHTSPQNFISNIETYIDSVDVIALLCPRQSDEVIQPC